MAKKTQKSAGAKRSKPGVTPKLAAPPKAVASAKTTARGRFNDINEVGRSRTPMKPQKAKGTVRS